MSCCIRRATLVLTVVALITGVSLVHHAYGQAKGGRVIRDRKSTRLNSTLFPYTTLFRSNVVLYSSSHPRPHGRGLDHRRLARSSRVRPGQGRPRHPRSEEHTSELHTLSLHDALPI